MRLRHRPRRNPERRRFRRARGPAEGRLDGGFHRPARRPVELALARWAKREDSLAIGFEHGHVYRVEGGAGHEAEDAHRALTAMAPAR